MSGLNALLGLRLIGMDGDAFVVALDIDDRHHHELGLVHGGIYLALADTAMARIAMRHLGGKSVQTAELKTSFLRPFASGTIRAQGRIVSAGRRLIFAEARIEGNGRLLATASATFATNDISGGTG